MRAAALALLLAPAAAAQPAPEKDMLMGSVVRSDNWKMDRVRNTEVFDGNVSFRNAFYTMKAAHAVYDRGAGRWTVSGDVYTERRFEDGSRLEMECDRGLYVTADETADLEGASRPVRMRYYAPDGRRLAGRCESVRAENRSGRMYFYRNFALSGEEIRIFSDEGLYEDSDKTFRIYGSTPLALGSDRGYDFALNGQEIRYFRDSRDIAVTDRVTGWVKDAQGAKPE